MSQIVCKNLWKIFGSKPEQVMLGLKTKSKTEALKTGHVLAVQDASFEVAKGEIFVIMGLSGSGKSTLIRCLSRLIEPTSGSFLLEGEDVFKMNELALRDLRRHRLSMVFQHFGLLPHKQVIDNVAYGLEVQGLDKTSRHQRAKEVLHLVGLLGWEYHYPSNLSGGMQQRVGIARALAVNPEILMFDEPFSALDPLIRRDMQDELLNLQKQLQKTILFITHDFLEAVKLGNRIAIMKDGQIVQIGTPTEIVMHPANDYVREFAKDVPRANVLTVASVMDKARAIHDPNESKLEHSNEPILYLKNTDGSCTHFLAKDDDYETKHPVNLCLRPDVTLGVAMAQVASLPYPVPVAQNGQLLGTLDRLDVMLALADYEPRT